jgi:hypothetical protein
MSYSFTNWDVRIVLFEDLIQCELTLIFSPLNVVANVLYGSCYERVLWSTGGYVRRKTSEEQLITFVVVPTISCYKVTDVSDS